MSSGGRYLECPTTEGLPTAEGLPTDVGEVGCSGLFIRHRGEGPTVGFAQRDRDRLHKRSDDPDVGATGDPGLDGSFRREQARDSEFGSCDG